MRWFGIAMLATIVACGTTGGDDHSNGGSGAGAGGSGNAGSGGSSGTGGSAGANGGSGGLGGAAGGTGGAAGGTGGAAGGTGGAAGGTGGAAGGTGGAAGGTGGAAGGTGGAAGGTGGAAGGTGGAGGSAGAAGGSGGAGGGGDCALGAYNSPAGLTLQDDAAVAAYEGYTAINTTIYLGSAVTSLAPLHCLSSISGSFWAQGTDLVNFNGLDNLQSIGNELVIEQNPLLTRLSGLESTSIATAVWLYGIPEVPGCEVDRLKVLWNAHSEPDPAYIEDYLYSDDPCD